MRGNVALRNTIIAGSSFYLFNFISFILIVRLMLSLGDLGIPFITTFEEIYQQHVAIKSAKQFSYKLDIRTTRIDVVYVD